MLYSFDSDISRVFGSYKSIIHIIPSAGVLTCCVEGRVGLLHVSVNGAYQYLPSPSL